MNMVWPTAMKMAPPKVWQKVWMETPMEIFLGGRLAWMARMGCEAPG
jgi:hypothetical protein